MTGRPQMSDLYEILTTILKDRLRVPAAGIAPDVTFAQLELDSIAFVELLLAVEDELGVRLDEDDINVHFTLRQTADLLAARGARV